MKVVYFVMQLQVSAGMDMIRVLKAKRMRRLLLLCMITISVFILTELFQRYLKER